MSEVRGPNRQTGWRLQKGNRNLYSHWLEPGLLNSICEPNTNTHAHMQPCSRFYQYVVCAHFIRYLVLTIVAYKVGQWVFTPACVAHLTLTPEVVMDEVRGQVARSVNVKRV